MSSAFPGSGVGAGGETTTLPVGRAGVQPLIRLVGWALARPPAPAGRSGDNPLAPSERFGYNSRNGHADRDLRAGSERGTRQRAFKVG